MEKPETPQWDEVIEKDHPAIMLKEKRAYNGVIYYKALEREGHKELSGMYISQCEGADFRLSVLTDLRNRGADDLRSECL